MKVLYFGGQKSGKSALAEEKTLKLSQNKKPNYIATYDNSYNDKEMSLRILNHKRQRLNSFNTIEELYDLSFVISPDNTYLVDCISMWIMNNINETEEYFFNQLEAIAKIDANIVFVLNDVSGGIIPNDKETRKFVDLTGIVGAKLTSICNEVYEVKFALEKRLK
jgi:adenosylcobinamide kinase/adenosylcobinamide-phosphate guanylyltransferase